MKFAYIGNASNVLEHLCSYGQPQEKQENRQSSGQSEIGNKNTSNR